MAIKVSAHRIRPLRASTAARTSATALVVLLQFVAMNSAIVFVVSDLTTSVAPATAIVVPAQRICSHWATVTARPPVTPSAAVRANSIKSAIESQFSSTSSKHPSRLEFALLEP